MASAFFLVFFWGSAFAAIRAGLAGYTPGQMAFLRFLIAGATLLLYALFRRFKLPALKDLPKIALSGFFGIFVYHLALNMGEREVPAGTASLLLSTLPLWTLLWAFFFLKERPTFWIWVGTFLSFAGVAAIYVRAGAALQVNNNVLLVLLASVAGSVFTALQKDLLKIYPPVEINFYAIAFGLLFLSPFAGGALDAWRSAPLEATLAVVYLGIFPAAIAFILWSLLLARMPASRAVGFLYLVPLFAVLTGWLWLGEKIETRELLGGGLILVGVILANTLGKRTT